MTRFEKVDGLVTTYIIDAARASNLQEDTIVLLVDTTVARTIVLPDYRSFINISLKIYILDGTGTASAHNISIIPYNSGTDKINGATLQTISVNYGCAFITGGSNQVTGANKWMMIAGGVSGGGTTPVIPITYADLLTLISSSSLTPGQEYEFTMTTVQYIQFSGSLGSEDIHTGTPEQLIVKALTVNSLYAEATSQSYPDDKILYKPIFTDREWDAVLGQSTGVIYSRTDTNTKNSRDYDFRNIVFRRWETTSGSGIYDSILDTGFAFQDSNSWNISNNGTFNSVIGSPGPLIAPLIGVSYQLDNVVFDAMAFSQSSNCALAFGATIFPSVFNSNAFDIGIMYFCTFLGGINSVIAVSTSTVRIGASGFSKCKIGNLSNSTIEQMQDCNILAMNSTNSPTAVYLSNNVIEIRSNTSTSVFNNSCNAITGNDVPIISGNICTSITDNSLPNASVAISDNIVVEISTNIGPNSTIGIVNNIGGQDIVNNDMSSYNILGNNCASISGNTLSSGNIEYNIGYNIQLNQCGAISHNQVNTIISNQNSGDIFHNVGTEISINTVNVSIISYNVVNLISNNGNYGPINYNTGFQINANLNGTPGNIASGEIVGNNTNNISGNSNAGQISSNSAVNIASNSNAGFISENISIYISDNLNGIGDIYGNNIYYISSNDKVLGSGGGPHNIQWCNGQNIVSVKLIGALLNCNNVRLQSNNIQAAIQNHTFLGAITGLNITPTADMISGAFPTQSLWDNGTATFRTMNVNSGVITFTDIT